MTASVPASNPPHDAYAAKHALDDAVARYLRKLSQPLEVLRHELEVDILASHLSGRIFDCTIGTGRFIGLLPKVSSYAGMDLSDAFVEYVRERFPDVEAGEGDLTKGIDCPDAAFDGALCLRSLSGIGYLNTILPEMVRILRPGGTMVIDYGRSPYEVRSEHGTYIVDGEDVDAVLRRLPVDVVARIRVDGLFDRIKQSPRLYRTVILSSAIIPLRWLKGLDWAFSLLFWRRQIIIARKRG